MAQEVQKRIRIRRWRRRCKNEKCTREHIVRNETRKLKRKKGSHTQRWICKGCGKSVPDKHGFLGRHFSAHTIAKALLLAATKMSSAEVCEQLKLDGITVHPDAVDRWIRHYSGIMSKFCSLLRVDAGFQWHVGELQIKINDGVDPAKLRAPKTKQIWHTVEATVQ